LYVIRTDNRDELQNYLKQNGIETGIHYPVPPHLQGAYRQLGYKKGDFPVAEKIAETCLSLPLNPGMTTAELGFITDCIKKFYA
jgi:dTDP-4-amino-4,6-dideoxygalactose transaminase